MSKTHFRLISLVLSVALLGLMMLAPAALAKKPKKNKKKATEDYVYRAPAIQLNASPTVLSACAGQPARVQLNAQASFPSGASPRYHWSASAGRIDGNGATTDWDLSGVKPGYYKASLEVDNGLTDECLAFSSAMVLVKCNPPTCPNIMISCPDKVEINQPMTFCANVVGGSADVKLVYNWSVSAGTIVKGEGTNCITVDTTGLAGQSVRATLDMPGYSGLNCSASCLVQIPNELPKCRKFDEYTNIKRNDEKARLDNYGIELQNDPTSTAYIVVYPGRSGKGSDAQQRSNAIANYLVNSRAIDKQRIVFVVGATRNVWAVELWVCPQGAKLPKSVGMP